MSDALHRSPNTHTIQADDCYRWFARSLLEGKVIGALRPLQQMLNDDPVILTRRKASSKVMLLVSALSSAGVDRLVSLKRYWKEVNSKFLFEEVKHWIRHEHQVQAKKLWIETVKQHIMQ